MVNPMQDLPFGECQFIAPIYRNFGDGLLLSLPHYDIYIYSTKS